MKTSLKGKKITVLGYGSQGRAQALNLRDSGCDVTVGLRSGSSSFKKTKKDKINAKSIPEALKGADFICFLFPDEFQAEVYQQYVKDILKKNMALVFAHGFNITFKKIKPPSDVDVFLAAPKGPGPTLRKAYISGQGLPFLVAIGQDASGKALESALAFAKAAGCLKGHVFKTTFKEETITDLFGEQTVLCGGVIELMKAAFETLVEGGLSPEMAYFECFHELKFIVDILHEKGIAGMGKVISHTAHYGGMTRGKRLINDQVKKELKKIFSEICSGKFAEEWLNENKKNLLTYKKLSREVEVHPIEKVGKKIRNLIGY